MLKFIFDTLIGAFIVLNSLIIFSIVSSCISSGVFLVADAIVLSYVILASVIIIDLYLKKGSVTKPEWDSRSVK